MYKGSTGVPKGVKISHKAVCQALLGHDEHIPIFSRFLQFASPTFDVSVFETFFPLFRGATLVSRDRESMLADLPGTIRAMKVDAAELTPTVASTLLKTREAAPCLQLLLTIGEMLTRPVIEEFGESKLRPGILYAMYGPTEASIHCTVAARVGAFSSIHNIGQPLATITATIIEALAEGSSTEYRILPKGKIGELAVAGQLASGYLNRPEQTTRAFIDLPGRGIFYRTGDRARIASDGDLEILGRLSSGQIKLRGQRVELGEIEYIACKAKGVLMAAASVVNDALVLFCVQNGGQTNVADIRSTCKRHLLPFMVPADIVTLELDTLPRLSSGKIDRKKIEIDYMRQRIAKQQNDTTPSDQVTKRICTCVSEELGRRVSAATSLWAEGLTSLMAIKIASSLRTQQIAVNVRDLLELETIAKIVERVKVTRSKVDIPIVSADSPIRDAEVWEDIQKAVGKTIGADFEIKNIEEILPCSAIQVAMLAETMSNMKLYFNSIYLRTALGISIGEIRTALQQLAQQNEILRSGFVPIDHTSAPFALVVWKELDLDQDLSLLHPFKVKSVENNTNGFIVQIHHALYDGWSWDIIMTDLNSLLTSRSIPERPQFRQVSHEQRRINRAQHEAAQDYWRRLLTTATPCLLPQLNGSPGSEPEQCVQRSTLKTTSQRLVEFALKYHTSQQTVLLTAVSLLLGLYTGSSSVILGLVSSGRHLPVGGIHEVIGPCLSTLPLSIDLSTVKTVQDLLMYIHHLELDQLEHGALSLRDVLAVTGMASQQTIFDTLFVWQESQTSSKPSPQLVETIETLDCLDYTLVIEAEPSGNEVIVKLNYGTGRVSQQQASCFLNQLDQLVDGIVANARTPVHDIWDTCDLEVLAVANTKPEKLDNQFDLASTIRDLAIRSPEQRAVSFVHEFSPDTSAMHVEELTYGELWQQSNQMAGFLHQSGVEADDIVCVLVEKSIDLYLLDLAIILAGGAFLNIDIRTPSERISQIFSQVKYKLVIADPVHGFVKILESIGQRCVLLSMLKTGAQQYQKNPFRPHANAEGSNLAYAVMTSGTTGVPKPILVTRDNLLSNIDILSKTYPKFADHNSLLQACSPAFDVFVFELFWTWHMGFSICSSTNDVLFRDIEGFIRAAKVTHLSLTPSVAALINPSNVPTVKFLVTAGEPMNSKVFYSWAGRGLFHGYGPAETTNICNVKGPVSRDDLINNVGPPFANTSILICAKQDDETIKSDIRVLLIGAVGEILIGGAQVARGYANQNLTTKSFIDTRYGRLYRSGDMGRLLANGDLIVLGREDDQVKLRGQRIELGDVNTTITRAPFVEDAATLVINGNNNIPRMISFWTKTGGQQPLDAVSSLYQFIEASLPPYMIPESLVGIIAMPLTRQGKIDKKMLIEHFKSLDDANLQRFSRGSTTSEALEKFTDQEMQFVQAVSEVTDTPLSKIMPNTSFYSLGLDSISGVRLSQKLRQMNIGHVDVSSILRHCSVRRLCRAVKDRSSVSSSKLIGTKLDEVFEPAWIHRISNLIMAEGYLVEKILPCTALQESILVSQANTPNSSTYEARMRFEVRGDVDRLRVAWSDMITRHQILRTGFIITPFADHAYVQVVLKDFELPCFASDEEYSNEIFTTKDTFIPPWRLILGHRCAGRPFSVTLIISHTLYDFEALVLLLRDVELKYHSQELNPVISPDAYSHYMLNMDMDQVDTFWRNRLEGFQPRSFVRLFQSFETETIDKSTQRTYSLVSRLSHQKLQTAAESYSSTSSNLLLTTWIRLLSCYTEGEDIVFGNVFSGRNLPIEGVADIIAPLFNTLPLRVRVTGRQSMRDLVTTTQTAILETLPFQPSPLRRIFRNQQLNGQPLFDTLVLVQSGDFVLDESVWALREEQGDMKFPGVVIEILPVAGNHELKLRLHVQSENIGSSTAQKILQNYDALLDEVVRYPQTQAYNFASISSDLPVIHVVPSMTPQIPFSEPFCENDTYEDLTALEINIRQLFSQFSGIEEARIAKETSIFELGLDSLHVVQIASELRQIGHHVTGADVLEANTIGRLSKACLSAKEPQVSFHHASFDLQAFDQKHRAGVCEQLQVKSSNIQAVYPCTSTQSGILNEFVKSKGDLYFNSMVLELRPEVDLTRMRNAWQITMNRNEMLRTGFVVLNTSDHTYGMVTYNVGVQDLPWLVEENIEAQQVKILDQDCLRSIHQPCWRLLLRKCSGSVRLEIYLLHSLYDAVSLDTLLSEAAAIYYDEDLKLPDSIPVETTLRTVLDQTKVSTTSSSDFWKHMGAGAPPLKFPNLTIHQHVGPQSLTVSRSCELLKDVEKGCRRLDVTLQSVFQIAWSRLLKAYTGESKAMFGVVLSGRIQPEMTGAMFPTINTVPFSVDVGGSTADMLIEATKINAHLFKHQFTPITAIKKWLRVEGELFDTILVIQKAKQARRNDRPWEVLEDRATAEYAISMEVLPQTDDSVDLRITAQLEIVPQDHMTILLRQYEALVREVLEEGSEAWSTPKSLLSIVEAKDESIPTGIKLLHEFVEETTMKTPDAIALEFADSLADGYVDKRCWTYRQLDEESNKIAHLLLVSGAKPGSFVAVCFDKCPEASFSILGVLKAGCAYVAVDPTAPIARKTFILEDSKCKILLTTKSFLFSLEVVEKLIMLVVDDRDLVQSQPTTRPILEKEVQPSDTCYCLYTSGTTGQPKGCLISHDSAVQAMLSFQRIFAGHWDTNSRWLQFASFHFDVSVLEQYWSWSVGICVTSAPRDVIFEDIPGAIDALQITHLDLTPSLARLLKPDQVPSLCRGVFIVGGEQVTQDIIDTWGDTGCLYNFYGPSEVTIGCTVHKMVEKGVKATNIGQPWDNVGAFVLEPGSERPVLRGAAGELCLSGPLVGKGYLNRPDLTAEKFVTLKEFDIQVYRSGDLVRLLHDDSFEFLGRIDDQVKLRGQRLEIREIDHAIKKASEAIVEVATTVIKHADQPSDQLIAFFTIRGQITKASKPTTLTSPTTDKIVSQVRRDLQDNLPAYMVPTHLLPVSHIPLSANNKVDLKALRSFYVGVPVRSLQNRDWNGSNIVPLTPTTKKVISALANFLSVSETEISPSARLFELGLDSISAVAFASVLRNAGFAGIDAAAVMRRPIVADLAYAIDISSGNDYEEVVEAANLRIQRFRHEYQGVISEPASIENFWPCTPLQENMLSKATHRGDAPYYLSVFHYEVNSKLSLDEIRASWRQVHQAFPILRTSFVKVSSKEHAQLVHRRCFEHVQYKNLDPSEVAITVLEEGALAWRREVDVLSSKPCWEVQILRDTTGRTYMSLRIFHGLYDANSLSILLSEVSNLLEKGTLQHAIEKHGFHEALPYGPLCQRAGAKEFWIQSLPKITPLNFSPNTSSLTKSSINIAHKVALPDGFVRARSKLAVTDSAIFQAACLSALYLQYGIFPTLGLVVSGRSFPISGIEWICGPLFNTVPFQITPESKWTRSDLIKACHEFNVDSKPFENTSLRDVRQWIDIDGGKPLFDILFVFQKDAVGAASKLDRLLQEITDVDQLTTPDYPLNIEARLSNDVMELTILADSEFLDKNDMQVLSYNFVKALEQLVESPEELLHPKERQLVGNERVDNMPKIPSQLEVDFDILQQVQMQVALLAQLDPAVNLENVNLFSLGLDSINFIQLSGILKKIGLPISVNVITRLSTTSKIAQYLTERKAQSLSAAQVPSDDRKPLMNAQLELRSNLQKQGVPLDRVEHVWPVTPMQEGVLASFEKYYHFALLKLSANTDVGRLRSAWNAAIMLHPVLRTDFIAIDDPAIKHVFAQLIVAHRDRESEILYVDGENQKQDLIDQANTEMIKVGLGFPSVFIKFIIPADSGNRYVLWGMSHAIYDGWSIQLLHQDILSLYIGREVQRPPIEPYLHYVLGRPTEDASAFWKNQLSNYTLKSFPLLSSDQSDVGRSHRITTKSSIDPSSIRQFCMDHAVTVQTLGLTIWTIVLSSYIKAADVCFGVVLACRDTDDADQLMFPTFNTVPIRPRLHPGSSRIALVKHIHQLSLHVAEHQDFPLREIKKLYHGSGRDSNDLFDTLFVMQKRSTTEERLPKLYEEVDTGKITKLDYPVNIEMDLGETSTLTWTVAVNGSVFDKAGVESLLAGLDRTLEAILRNSNGIALSSAESAVETGKERPSGNINAGLIENRSPGTKIADPELHAMIFDTVAVVARCSVDTLSYSTNIYSLGLDSISVIKVASLLRKQRISLPVSAILAAVTLDKIINAAKWISYPENPSTSGNPITKEASLPKVIQSHLSAHKIPKEAIEAVLPASAGQTFMLDFYRASRGRLFYPTFRYKVQSRIISENELLRAWNTVLEAFPALRTRFCEHEGTIWQVVIRGDYIKKHPPAAQFTPTQMEGGFIVDLQLHHALYDAVSLPIVISALEKAYQGRVLQPRIGKNALKTFISATRGVQTAEISRTFWTTYLAQAGHAHLPNAGTFESHRIEHVQEYAIADSATLISRAGAAGVSLQALFLAAVGSIYSRLVETPRDIVVVGVYLANRGLDIEGLEDLAVPTVSIVPLVIDVKLDVLDSAKKIQGDLATVQQPENCGVTLRAVYDWTGVKIDCFVNFVPRMGDGSEDDDMCGDGDGETNEMARLVSYPYESRDGALRQGRELTSPFLGSQMEKELPWCLPSVDVEAKLEDGGGLTMGIFAPADKLGDEGAMKMNEDITQVLLSFQQA